MNFNKYLKSILIGIMNLSISFIGKGEQKYKYPWEVWPFQQRAASTSCREVFSRCSGKTKCPCFFATLFTNILVWQSVSFFCDRREFRTLFNKFEVIAYTEKAQLLSVK